MELDLAWCPTCQRLIEPPKPTKPKASSATASTSTSKATPPPPTKPTRSKLGTIRDKPNGPTKMKRNDSAGKVRTLKGKDAAPSDALPAEPVLPVDNTTQLYCSVECRRIDELRSQREVETLEQVFQNCYLSDSTVLATPDSEDGTAFDYFSHPSTHAAQVFMHRRYSRGSNRSSASSDSLASMWESQPSEAGEPSAPTLERSASGSGARPRTLTPNAPGTMAAAMRRAGSAGAPYASATGRLPLNAMRSSHRSQLSTTSVPHLSPSPSSPASSLSGYSPVGPPVDATSVPTTACLYASYKLAYAKADRVPAPYGAPFPQFTGLTAMPQRVPSTPSLDGFGLDWRSPVVTSTLLSSSAGQQSPAPNYSAKVANIPLPFAVARSRTSSSQTTPTQSLAHRSHFPTTHRGSFGSMGGKSQRRSSFSSVGSPSKANAVVGVTTTLATGLSTSFGADGECSTVRAKKPRSDLGFPPIDIKTLSHEVDPVKEADAERRASWQPVQAQRPASRSPPKNTSLVMPSAAPAARVRAVDTEVRTWSWDQIPHVEGKAPVMLYPALTLDSATSDRIVIRERERREKEAREKGKDLTARQFHYPGLGEDAGKKLFYFNSEVV